MGSGERKAMRREPDPRAREGSPGIAEALLWPSLAGPKGERR